MRAADSSRTRLVNLSWSKPLWGNSSLYLSANRDEAAFEDPFTFNIHRSPNRHVGFGFGGHICLGIHLARMEMIALWKAILPRLKSVELAGTPRTAESEFVCGPKSVPIRFTLED